MKAKELNKLLVEKFPGLQEKYIEETSWQEGEDTGSHTVYGDVFTPYLVECIKENREEEIISCFDFLERLLEFRDVYVEEVVTFSVFESIEYLFKETDSLTNLLKKNSRKVLDEFEM